MDVKGGKVDEQVESSSPSSEILTRGGGHSQTKSVKRSEPFCPDSNEEEAEANVLLLLFSHAHNSPHRHPCPRYLTQLSCLRERRFLAKGDSSPIWSTRASTCRGASWLASLGRWWGREAGAKKKRRRKKKKKRRGGRWSCATSSRCQPSSASMAIKP